MFNPACSNAHMRVAPPSMTPTQSPARSSQTNNVEITASHCRLRFYVIGFLRAALKVDADATDAVMTVYEIFQQGEDQRQGAMMIPTRPSPDAADDFRFPRDSAARQHESIVSSSLLLSFFAGISRCHYYAIFRESISCNNASQSPHYFPAQLGYVAMMPPSSLFARSRVTRRAPRVFMKKSSRRTPRQRRAMTRPMKPAKLDISSRTMPSGAG